MSKKWTEAQPRSNDIVNYREFNKGYNAYKSFFNGGLDRTTMPDELLTSNEITPGAFHSVTIQNSNDMSIATDASTGSADEWRGPSYSTYNGGWLNVDTVNLTQFKDGMCHWEYTFFYLNLIQFSFQSNISVEPKGLQVRMKWDDTIVFESYKIAQSIGTARMVADFPTTAGNHTATVEVRQVNQGPNDPNNLNVVNIVSPSHLIIGRWR